MNENICLMIFVELLTSQKLQSLLYLLLKAGNFLNSVKHSFLAEKSLLKIIFSSLYQKFPFDEVSIYLIMQTKVYISKKKFKVFLNNWKLCPQNLFYNYIYLLSMHDFHRYYLLFGGILLQIVLQGGYAGNAAGMKISSLHKLTDIR